MYHPAMNKQIDRPELSFSCKRCGYCCSQHGRYNYLYVTEKDIRRLAAALNMSANEFKKKLTRLSDKKRVIVFKNRICPFYDKRSCTVYNVRPGQCSSWPYWKENIRRNKFNPALKRICPGVGWSKRADLNSISNYLQIFSVSSRNRLYGIAIRLSAMNAPLDRLIIDTLAAVSSSGAS